MNGSGDGRLRNDVATSIASYHIIAISPIGFRHYNLFYIYRAVPFFTLWLLSRYSPIRELPFWTSLFLSARVAVLDVDVHIMTSSVMLGSHYAIFVVKTSVVRLNDERRKSCDRSHYTTARDSLAHTTRQKFSVGDIRATAILVD